MDELLQENKALKERIEFLEKVLHRGNAGNSTAYTSIRLMIIEKVDKEFDATKFENWRRKSEIQKVQRQIMRDLKWELRVRQISDFRTEHIELARKYIEDYKIEN